MRSILRGLPKQPKQDNHFAAMPYPRVPALMKKLAETASAGRLALRFLILTAARSGEVRGATWGEIDLEDKTWTIPGDRMKAGKKHVVPLSQDALDVLDLASKLQTTGDDHVFPGNKNKALSDMTLTKALRDLGINNVTVHGFRSSFRDWAAEQTSTAGDVVEAALAHTIANKVEAAYRRTNYLEKRRVLMDTWAQYLADPEDNVVSLVG